MKPGTAIAVILAVTLVLPIFPTATPAEARGRGGRGVGVGVGGRSGAVMGGPARGVAIGGSRQPVGRSPSFHHRGPRTHVRFEGRFSRGHAFAPRFRSKPFVGHHHHVKKSLVFFGFGAAAYYPSWWWYDPYYYWLPPPAYYPTYYPSAYYPYPDYGDYTSPWYDESGYPPDPCLSLDPAYAEQCAPALVPPERGGDPEESAAQPGETPTQPDAVGIPVPATRPDQPGGPRY
jgi:hypothetical protein